MEEITKKINKIKDAISQVELEEKSLTGENEIPRLKEKVEAYLENQSIENALKFDGTHRLIIPPEGPDKQTILDYTVKFGTETTNLASLLNELEDLVEKIKEEI